MRAIYWGFALFLVPMLTWAEATLPGNQENSDFFANAEFRLRFQLDSKRTFLDGGNSQEPSSVNSFKQRFKFGVQWRKGASISTRLGLIHNMDWGASSEVQQTSSDSSLGVHDGDSGHNSLLVNEAIANWLINESLILRIGRGPIEIGEGSVMSENDYEAIPYTFDGAYLSYDTDTGIFSLFGLKLAEYSYNGIAHDVDDPEQNIYGFSFDIRGLPSYLRLIHLHLIQVNKDEQGGLNDSTKAAELAGESTLRYGFSMGGDTTRFDYRAVVAGHTGNSSFADKETELQGIMYEIELGLKFPDTMNLRIFGLYHSDSGDNDAVDTEQNKRYDPYFYEQHGRAGLMDVVGWGNLTFYAAGMSIQPKDDIQVGLQYLSFSRTQTEDFVGYQKNGSIFDGLNGQENEESHIGSEIDLYADKTYLNNFSLGARFGMFMPGDYMKDDTVGLTKTYMQYLIQGKMTF